MSSVDYTSWRFWKCPDCDRVTIFVEDECQQCGFNPVSKVDEQ